MPLPATPAALHASAALGRRVAALLDVETPVPGVTSGALDPALRAVAAPAALDGRTLGATPADFAVTARWGYTRPHRAGDAGAGPHRRPSAPRRLDAALGPAARDVLWSDTAAWTAVPDAVWGYTLGGYPVLKKWLSYRSLAVLGRPLRLRRGAGLHRHRPPHRRPPPPRPRPRRRACGSRGAPTGFYALNGLRSVLPRLRGRCPKGGGGWKVRGRETRRKLERRGYAATRSASEGASPTPMRPLHDAPFMRDRRRALRRRQTPSEVRLWQVLRDRQTGGWRFRRQHSVGPYVLDFYCVAARVGVEVDGGIHARPEVAAYDAARTAWLADRGVRIVRVPNAAVLRDAGAVADEIAALLAALHPTHTA